MSNILNNNFQGICVNINNDEYWDLHLNKDAHSMSAIQKGLQDRCLISYIDTNDPNCLFFDEMFAKDEYFWKDCVCSDVTLKNVGFVGMDNGLINYKRDKITNEEFMELYTGSTLSLTKEDKRLKLHKVTGNTGLWDYPSYIISNGDITTVKLNGGFYQGFFKLHDYDYQVLPTMIPSNWAFEFTIKKEDFPKESDKILNEKYPNNKGIFFYIGTRAENKLWHKYGKKENITIDQRCDTSYCENSYFDGSDYLLPNGNLLNTDFLQNGDDYVETDPESYFKDSYLEDNLYGDTCQCEECKGGKYPCGDKPINTTTYFNDDYISDEGMTDLSKQNRYLLDDDYIIKDVYIDENAKLKTHEGYDMDMANIFEIPTKNKFIWFNRTPTGYTTNNFKEDDEYVLTGRTATTKRNYFTLFNRTPTGYTTNTINKLIETDDNLYDYRKDITNNAFALRIKDDGSIGYRYMILDCNDENKFGIIEEYSTTGLIKHNEWNTIHVRLKMINVAEITKCSKYKGRKMRLYFYVNGYLKFISKEIPELHLRGLNDLKEKQEGVPYNISLGGGTQGLCDMITLNHQKIPEYVLPLEKYFGGSFIGEFKTFKFYECQLTSPEIVNNVEFEKNSIK